MVWAPRIAATDVRAIVGNLFTYFDENQADALAWASPGRALEKLTLYPTAEVRILTDFPHLGLVRRRISTDDRDDGLHVRYDLTFELEVAASHKDGRSTALIQLQADADAYAYAFESMALNIPNATLFAGITGTGHGNKNVTTHEPIEHAIGPSQSVFNTQVQVSLEFVENP